MQRSSMILFCCDLIENGGVFKSIPLFLKQNKIKDNKIDAVFLLTAEKIVDFKRNWGAKKMTLKKMRFDTHITKTQKLFIIHRRISQ